MGLIQCRDMRYGLITTIVSRNFIWLYYYYIHKYKIFLYTHSIMTYSHILVNTRILLFFMEKKIKRKTSNKFQWSFSVYSNFLCTLKEIFYQKLQSNCVSKNAIYNFFLESICISENLNLKFFYFQKFWNWVFWKCVF